MTSCYVLAVLVSLIAGSQAHMCMLSPRQRGTMMDLNTHATADCYLTMGPCGGRPMGAPAIDLRAGQNFTVVLQKNFSHLNKPAPGDFWVKFGLESNAAFDTLATIPDTADASLSLYTVDVMIPSQARGMYVLQAIYRTNNIHAPAMFYQCADVFVV